MVSYDDPFYHEENYDGLTDAQRLDKLKLERASVRNLASKKHRTVVTQLRYANASTADIDSATDVCTRLCEALAQFDEFILELDQNDVQSDDYFAKLKEALTCLTVDAENAHKRDMRILNLSMTRASLTSAASPSSNHQTAAPAPWSSRKSAKNDLPVFDGAPSNYRRWIKMYEELVENNLAYEPTAKFLALVEKVGPVGKDLIGDLDPDLEGIRIAKECLSKHFEDKRRIREDVCVKVRRLKRFSPNMPSSTLRQSVIVLERANKALEAANVGSTYLDGQFYDIIIPKLTDQMAMDYHRAHPDDSQRTAKGLIEFIKTEVEIFIRTNDAIALANESATPISPSVPHTRSRPISTVTHRNSPSTNGVIMNCNICQGPHKTIYCNSHDANTRRSIATQKGLCLRCLQQHPPNQCPSRYQCSTCRLPHSRVVCDRVLANQSPRAPAHHPQRPGGASQFAPSAPPLPGSQINNQAVNPQLHFHVGNTFSVTSQSPLDIDLTKVTSYLPTVIVTIQGHRTRVLLDTGASKSIITEPLANKLMSQRATQKLPLSGAFSSGIDSTSAEKILVDLVSLDKSYTMDGVVLSIVPNLTPLYLNPIPDAVRERMKSRGFDLAEGDEPVEIILSVTYVNLLWLGLEIPFEGNLTVRHSKFGWTVSGDMPSVNDPRDGVQVISTVHESMHRPAVISLPDPDRKLEDEYLDEFIQQNVHYRDKRYSVNLPWIEGDREPLSHNRELALKRLERQQYSLQRKGLSEQYKTALDEMIDRFAEPAPAEPGSHVYYLPHHCVVRADRSTTQTRIVFDGSSHELDKKSINDKLYKGLIGWDSLSLLLKFRMGRIAVTSDIEKAYLMIGVEPEDRDALRFLTIENGQVRDWRFKVVPFGISSSPAMLYATLESHAKRFAKEYPDVVPLIRDRMYVDDLILTFESIQPDQLNNLKDRIVDYFSKASMNIRKWRTNVPELDAKWAPDGKESVKVLGHLWSVHDDTLSLSIDIDRHLQLKCITKRVFTSISASVYDPTGLISPFQVQLRLFTRELWARDSKWDTVLPDELHTRAAELIKQVTRVNEVTVVRNVLPPDGSSPRLVIYCDASKSALGVVAYCVTDSQSQLLYSKARLARDATIPTLELDALVLATETARYLRTLYPFDVVIVYSDSLLNLQRLMQHPNTQKPSITLRIRKIKRLTSATFRHVTTKDNHADLVSRGCSLPELLNSKRWWSGPEPSTKPLFDTSTSTSFVGALIAESSSSNCVCPEFPDYVSMLRHYMQQIVTTSDDSTSNEQALVQMIKAVQSSHFASELEALQSSTADDPPLPSNRRNSSAQIERDRSNRKKLDRDSVLRNYVCFLDSNGIIRIRTRLVSGSWPTHDQVCPILMPSHCNISRLIVVYEHERNLHAGIERVIGSVRERYFVIGLRRLVKSVTHHCEYCQLQVGDTVFLKRDTPMDTWPKGTMVSLHTSPDGIVRTATVRVLERNQEKLKREDVKRLIPLECGFDRPTETSNDSPPTYPDPPSSEPNDQEISQANTSPPEDVTRPSGSPSPDVHLRRSQRRRRAAQ